MFLVSIQGMAQNASVYEVKGVIRDSLTNETLPFANVFFSGTTYGTTSNDQGVFSLKVNAPGTYDLVISFLGYKTFTRQIDLNEAGTAVLDVPMLPDVKSIGGVTVTAKKDQEWRDNLEVFKQTFLGTSENVASCRILNEEVLNFDYNRQTRIFEAYSGEPLIIENRALGYKITYVLEYFAIDYKYNYSSYYGFTSFEDMSKKDKVKKRWAREREKAYYGSLQHFIRAVYRGETVEEGFEINQARDVEGMGRVLDSNPYDINSTVKLSEDSIRKEFAFEHILYINYTKEAPSPNYRTGGLRINKTPEIRKGSGQLSWVTMMEGVDKVQFEQSGYLINPLAIVLEGYWSFEKTADMLPINYQPSADH